MRIVSLFFLVAVVLAANAGFVAAQTCSTLYGQCGGSGWTGATCCTSSVCVAQNEWYSQCMPGTTTAVATSSTTTTVTTKTTTTTVTTTTASKSTTTTVAGSSSAGTTTTTSKTTTTSAVAAAAVSTASLLAFPGAEGFGRLAVGGRKGSVYVVTNLADSGAGSLRDAVSVSNRIVVFAVGGVINIDERIVVSSRITILGQTAPGGGITVYGNGWSFSNSDNTIVRYIRIRMGKGGTDGKDAITIAEGSTMIFDHVSVSWGRDETFSINGDVYNITIQNSIIAQGLETHSCGGLMQTDYGVSLFRNFYIDNKTRNPKVKGMNDFTNNVIYNWGGGGGYIAGDSDGLSYANIMGNYFISGPSTSVTAFTRGNANFFGYVSNNFYDPDQDGILDGTKLGESATNYGGMVIVTTRFDYPPVARLLTPLESVNLAISSVGASLVRDSIDTRLITELQSWGKTGQLISDETVSPMYGPGTISSGTTRTDTDGDGIPDDVEKTLGTNPNVADSMGDVNGNGYTNVEDWANSLVPSSY